jgi:hypothetical protein
MPFRMRGDFGLQDSRFFPFHRMKRPPFRLDMKEYQAFDRDHEISLDKNLKLVRRGSSAAAVCLMVRKYRDGNDYIMACHYLDEFEKGTGFKMLAEDWALCRVLPTYDLIAHFNHK